MDGKCLLRSLKLTNFLSYGSASEPIGLEPLNVLIGPNTSGKSNLLEALEILRAVPKDVTTPIREGGGTSEWLWKGGKSTPTAQIDAVVDYPEGIMPLRYKLEFTVSGQRFELVDEVVENERPTNDYESDVYFFYRYQSGHPVLNYRQEEDAPAGSPTGRAQRFLRREDIEPGRSVLSQRKDSDHLPEITYLGQRFSDIRLFREWVTGRYTPPRLPQKADLPEDFLLEDCSNLGLVLNDLQQSPDTKRLLSNYLKRFYDDFDDITTKVYAGTVQINVHELGLRQPVPATRLSDGMLRYLCLLAVLCHPKPPPLVCIEEPEIGLHPDMMATVAELLIEARERTQLVVTTHSDALVAALSPMPESVIVCERDPAGSHLRRLDQEALVKWLKKYSLGDLWRMGKIGGNR